LFFLFFHPVQKVRDEKREKTIFGVVEKRLYRLKRDEAAPKSICSMMLNILRRSEKWLKQFLHHRLVQHLAFWGLSFYVLFRLFSLSNETLITDLVYTLLFHLSLLLLVYGNIGFLIPRFLSKKKYLQLVSGSLFLLLTSIALNLFTFNILADILFPGYYFIAYYDWRNLLEFMLAYGAISTLLKLSKSWFRVNEQEKMIQQLEKQRTKAELEALRNQLDPHFLFNNLNTLYAMALYQDTGTADAILKLSQNMRYLLYECRQERVELSREIQHIQHFLELFRLRTGDGVETSFTVLGEAGERLLAPLLFTPLLENAVKHSRPNSRGEHYIRASLRILPGKILFLATNSRGKEKENKDSCGGIGLTNLRRRLELLYPEQFELKLDKQKDVFSASLSLSSHECVNM
jgi:two-component system LytT family sensor kinase